MLRIHQPLARWLSVLFVPVWLGTGLPPVAASSAQDVVAAQIVAGREVYERECVRCHGPMGSQGETAPSLISPEMGHRLTAYPTASALFTFLRFAMPQDKPGTLPEADYWAVLAFVLAQNGLLKEQVMLGTDTAEGVRLQR